MEACVAIYTDIKSGLLALVTIMALTTSTWAVGGGAPADTQAQGFPDSLRRYSDSGKVPFKIGTAVIFQGGPNRNGYHPGILGSGERDRAIQSIISTQFNQIEPENELKMMSLWTDVERVDGHYAAVTNLFDDDGPLAKACHWAQSMPHPVTVRGHCMVYHPRYNLPRFQAGHAALFDGTDGSIKLNPAYSPNDLRDLLESFVRQSVDAGMVHNAMSRVRHKYKVIEMWDVTNEVVSDDTQAAPFPGIGFAYRHNDPWYANGPRLTADAPGYDYVADIYRWADDEMRQNAGKTVHGQKITAGDGFSLYYNDYNLEWNPEKMKRTLALIDHVRASGGRVDGLGFQAHIEAKSPISPQFEKSIQAAIDDKLRFAITELDCAISRKSDPGTPPVDEQEKLQGTNVAEVAGLCVKYGTSCDCLQWWGATDDGSWLPNAEATLITRWVAAAGGKEGYWPKQGQHVPATTVDPETGDLDMTSARSTSDAFDKVLDVLRQAAR